MDIEKKHIVPCKPLVLTCIWMFFLSVCFSPSDNLDLKNEFLGKVYGYSSTLPH